MMLMFPVSSSITCTCPGDLPGKARIFCPKQAKPSGLSEVSNTDSFFGGDENANTWMLFSNATTIRDLDRRTPRTDVRNSRVMAAFCFASSQITSYGRTTCQFKAGKCTTGKEAYLVLRELGIPSSANYRQVVGLAKHFDYSDAGIEVCGRTSRSDTPLQVPSTNFMGEAHL